jgi:DNA-binding NarL/FixJ family response regulator
MKRRVLVVEDHEWWRRYICAELGQTRQWEVAGAVSDGIEAVRKARDLKPDLILLDVGLPGLSGIQAGRRILAHDPGSRILIVTEQQSLDVAQAALGIGARGFIVKSDAGRDLLPAMEAVIEGERFISVKMAGRGFESNGHENRCHEAGFYADESLLLDDYASFVEAALDAGNGLVMVFTRARRDRLHQRLKTRNIDLDRTITEGRGLWFDVRPALSGVMVDGRVDEARFWSATSALMIEAAKGSKLSLPRVSVCGDGAATLLQDGLIETAIRFELLWDDVARAFNVDTFCPYSSHGLHCHDENKVFRDLSAAHSAVHVR